MTNFQNWKIVHQKKESKNFKIFIESRTCINWMLIDIRAIPVWIKRPKWNVFIKISQGKNYDFSRLFEKPCFFQWHSESFVFHGVWVVFLALHLLLHTRGLKSYIYPKDCSVSLAKNVKFNNKPDISLLRCTEDIISFNVVFKANKL